MPRKAAAKPVNPVADNTANTEVVAEVSQNKAPVEKHKYKVKSNLNPRMIVTVRNGFNGALIYKSRRTGERFEWFEFGGEQDMELQELKAAKNNYPAFFQNNWFLIDDPEVIEYLGVSQYYKNALTYEEFDNFFNLPADEVKEKISLLSKGQKLSVAYRAKQLIAEGEIDSIKVINAIEESLGIDLIER